jgi:hypothetical protein
MSVRTDSAVSEILAVCPAGSVSKTSAGNQKHRGFSPELLPFEDGLSLSYKRGDSFFRVRCFADPDHPPALQFELPL